MDSPSNLARLSKFDTRTDLSTCATTIGYTDFRDPMRKITPMTTIALLTFAVLGCNSNTIAPPQVSITLTVEPSKVLHPISPYIYGVNQADWTHDHKYETFGRIGGNRITAYNWETNASNAGADWHHQNDGFMGGGDVAGESMRKSVAAALDAGKSILVTVPTAGYVAADKKGDGDVNQTPNYLETRFVKTFAKKKRPFVYPPDLNDHAVYEDEFVWWIEKTFKNRPAGTELFYALDNEPDIWNGTHVRIWPKKPTYADIIRIDAEYANAIKDVAPKALVFGPASYGWGGMTNFQGAPDAKGRDFLEFYLSEMKNAEQSAGRRILDVLDLHWYTEAYANKKRITEEDTSPESVAVRVQSTRGLWDPSYDEPSWIAKSLGGKPVMFIPRIMEKIKKCYPGTKLAITEYNYGGSKHISGGIAEADALGIFGREDIFAASIWGGTDKGSFNNGAFDAFRNFDGNGGHFGDLCLAATTSDVTKVAFYASKDSKSGQVVLVVINRTSDSTTCNVKVGNGKSATAFRMTSASPTMVAAGSESIDGGSFRTTLPAMSVTTYAIN